MLPGSGPKGAGPGFRRGGVPVGGGPEWGKLDGGGGPLSGRSRKGAGPAVGSFAATCVPRVRGPRLGAWAPAVRQADPTAFCLRTRNPGVASEG